MAKTEPWTQLATRVLLVRRLGLQGESSFQPVQLVRYAELENILANLSTFCGDAVRYDH